MSHDAGWYPGNLGQALAPVASASFLPPKREDLAAMLELYLIDKALCELRYELNLRPDRPGIPPEGLFRRVDQDAARLVGVVR